MEYINAFLGMQHDSILAKQSISMSLHSKQGKAASSTRTISGRCVAMRRTYIVYLPVRNIFPILSCTLYNLSWHGLGDVYTGRQFFLFFESGK